jgi:hypothetical protein
VILADTSAWIEFLRRTGSQLNRRFYELLERDQLATTDAVLMEVLAGARDRNHRKRLHELLLRCTFLASQGPRDYLRAADIARTCRTAGEKRPGMIDCLIASVAIRSEVPLLHGDADFDAIARHTPLSIA